MSTFIQSFIDESEILRLYLLTNGMLSESINLDNNNRKVLLLSCASFYETEICEMLKQFIDKQTKNTLVSNFVMNKAIERQYHTYFQWKDAQNINSFLGLFGNEFKQQVSLEIKDSVDISKYMKAFLTIGSERNKLVHENFLIYNLEKTFTEIVMLHNDAQKFIDFLKIKFNIIENPL